MQTVRTLPSKTELALRKDSEKEACVALNKHFIRCCNSSLQLLQSYFRLSSALTIDHSVRKQGKKLFETSGSQLLKEIRKGD